MASETRAGTPHEPPAAAPVDPVSEEARRTDERRHDDETLAGSTPPSPLRRLATGAALGLALIGVLAGVALDTAGAVSRQLAITSPVVVDLGGALCLEIAPQVDLRVGCR